MDYSEMAVMLLKKCTAECDSCCIGASPYETEKLDCERLKNFLKTVKDVEDIKTIHFSVERK